MPVSEWFDHFGFLAPSYDSLIRLREPERMARFLKLPTEGYLLDAGGGTGRVSEVLAGQAGLAVVADVSLGMLRRAKAKPGLQPLGAAAERLPFADGSFARVLMVDALHHVYSAEQTCAELWRVLAPGGRLVVEEPDIRTVIVKFVAVLEKLALMRSHFIDPRQIGRWFAAFPGAHVHLQTEGYNTWVMVDKKP